MAEDTEGTRLQKVLAAAGIASRRASEILIEEGRVEVNGAIVTEQGRRVNPETDRIRVDGARIPPPRRHVYMVLNKPKGVVSTMEDPEGRPTLSDYLPRTGERLFHVGRCCLWCGNGLLGYLEWVGFGCCCAVGCAGAKDLVDVKTFLRADLLKRPHAVAVTHGNGSFRVLGQ